MIFMLTVWSPLNKGKEAMDAYAKALEKGVPKSIRKWQIFTVADGINGIKSYELIYTEKGQADEALVAIHRSLALAAGIEGYSFKIEPLLGMKDLLSLLPSS